MPETQALRLGHCRTCGRSLVERWCLWCGVEAESARIGRYEVEALFPANPAGSLLLAHDPLLARSVVIRVLPDWTDGEQSLQLSAIRHPNCVTVHSVLQPSGHVILVMEYLPNRLTATHPRSRTATALAQAADGLDFVHRHGYIHGRISFNNILLSPDGPAKLADAGLPPRSGDLSYAAPEVIAGGRPSAAADVYSLAALARHALTGTPPEQLVAPLGRVELPLDDFLGPVGDRGTAADLRDALRRLT